MGETRYVSTPTPLRRGAVVRQNPGMSEWVSAAIGAGSAVVGGIVTGWFTRSAGHRQADAAAHAGNRQADALISSVRETLDEQRAQSHWEARRNVYVQFLDAVGSRAGGGYGLLFQSGDETAVPRAFMLLELEGPTEVVQSGRALMEAVDRRRGPEGLSAFDAARVAFINVARSAMVR